MCLPLCLSPDFAKLYSDSFHKPTNMCEQVPGTVETALREMAHKSEGILSGETIVMTMACGPMCERKRGCMFFAALTTERWGPSTLPLNLDWPV